MSRSDTESSLDHQLGEVGEFDDSLEAGHGGGADGTWRPPADWQRRVVQELSSHLAIT